uniref:Uncharacterized protein n=1 Tax=Rhizophora mucronata TaxID=61149 RepID=A0A2P2QC47_RHIMU
MKIHSPNRLQFINKERRHRKIE